MTFVCYGYVEPGASPPKCEVRAVTPDIDEYLNSHIAELLRYAERSTAPPAEFLTTEASSRFKVLEGGSPDEFLEVTQHFATEMHRRIDRRAKKGFVVGVRCTHGGVVYGAVLKLDVNGGVGAAMGHGQRGEPTLEAVKHLLDVPGQLQKGAITPDQRANSDIIVSEKLQRRTAAYFLDTIQVRQREPATSAVPKVLQAVRAVAPDRVMDVAVAMENQPSQMVEEFFEAHPDLLLPEEREEVTQQLRSLSRPVEEMNPCGHPTQQVIEADGISVHGRLTTMQRKVRTTKQGDQWIILATVDEEPRVSYK